MKVRRVVGLDANPGRGIPVTPPREQSRPPAKSARRILANVAEFPLRALLSMMGEPEISESFPKRPVSLTGAVELSRNVGVGADQRDFKRIINRIADSAHQGVDIFRPPPRPATSLDAAEHPFGVKPSCRSILDVK